MPEVGFRLVADHDKQAPRAVTDRKPNSPRYQLRQVCSDSHLKGLIFVYNLLSAKCCIQPTNWIAAGVIGKSCRLTVQIKGLGNVSSMGTMHS